MHPLNNLAPRLLIAEIGRIKRGTKHPIFDASCFAVPIPASTGILKANGIVDDALGVCRLARSACVLTRLSLSFLLGIADYLPAIVDYAEKRLLVARIKHIEVVAGEGHVTLSRLVLHHLSLIAKRNMPVVAGSVSRLATASFIDGFNHIKARRFPARDILLKRHALNRSYVDCATTVQCVVIATRVLLAQVMIGRTRAAGRIHPEQQLGCSHQHIRRDLFRYASAPREPARNSNACAFLNLGTPRRKLHPI